jgi:hypothetical protein
VPKQVLQGEYIALVPQVSDGEGVPEPVRMHFLDASTFPQSAEQCPENIATHWAWLFRGTHREHVVILGKDPQSGCQ